MSSSPVGFSVGDIESGSVVRLWCVLKDHRGTAKTCCVNELVTLKNNNPINLLDMLSQSEHNIEQKEGLVQVKLIRYARPVRRFVCYSL